MFQNRLPIACLKRQHTRGAIYFNDRNQAEEQEYHPDYLIASEYFICKTHHDS